jgi:hypothetical protein
MEHIVAVKDVCAWPNLQKLSDGTIVAAVFNQPCHGLWEGDLDCWASGDEGRTWQFRSRIAEHDAGTNCMNCAAGVTENGDILVACSGWDGRGPVGEPRAHGGCHTLPVVVRKSCDGGATWSTISTLPPCDDKRLLVPYGNIVGAADGALCITAYTGTSPYASWLLRSVDEGITWIEPALIDAAGNETCTLHLGHGRWLAASRHEADSTLHLFSSDDDARAWFHVAPLTRSGWIPGNLIRLLDGRVLLSYGNRWENATGIDVRMSSDEGRTWGAPVRIANSDSPDSGYPSSVQLSSGTVVTAFYTKIPDAPGLTNGSLHWTKPGGYEMRAVRWMPDEIL